MIERAEKADEAATRGVSGQSQTVRAGSAAPASGRPSPRSPTAAHLVALQRVSGNRAVSAMVSSISAVTVQRDDEPTTLAEALAGDDPAALRKFQPFGALSAADLRRVCRLVIDRNTWVGPDDETTIESAWRAVAGDKRSLGETDWMLWKECENYGTEVRLIPWMREIRLSFADRVRASALESVARNVRAIRGEAARLGISVDGSALKPTAESDLAVHEQRVLAHDIKEAHVKQQQLRSIPVGYAEPSWGSTLPPGGTPDIEPKKVATYDPSAGPYSRAEPDPDPAAGIANWEAVKSLDEEITSAVAQLLEKNPALYAMTARGGTDPIVGDSVESARRQMADALLDVLKNAATTKQDIESRSLGFSEMLPVHATVLSSDPMFKDAFSKQIAKDYIAEEGDADAAANKLVGLLTIALITSVQVASGGTATPVVGALISLAASAGTAAASWNDWAKLEAAAKSTASDRDAVVTEGQAAAAQIGALISTAAALFDVYGVSKAMGAASASAKAAVSALESKVADPAFQLRRLGRGAAVENAGQLVDRSVASIGPAATARNTANWQKLIATVSPGSGTTRTLTGWRDATFRAAERVAAKAAAGAEGETARAALAVAAGIEQAALSEALDAVIEIFVGGGNEELGYIGVGGSTFDLTAGVEQYVAQKYPVARVLQRSIVEVVEVPLSALDISSMTPAEFEQIIVRGGTASGHFAQQGLPRMTVIEGKVHGGGHGYDGIGISSQGNLIHLHNLEGKHVRGDSSHIPRLGATEFGTQGGRGWNAAKARALLNADNPFAEETREMLTKALTRRIGRFDASILEDTLAGALGNARFTVFTPVWAKTEVLLAQLRGLAASGVAGKLIRIAPRRR